MDSRHRGRTTTPSFFTRQSRCPATWQSHWTGNRLVVRLTLSSLVFPCALVPLSRVPSFALRATSGPTPLATLQQRRAARPGRHEPPAAGLQDLALRGRRPGAWVGTLASAARAHARRGAPRALPRHGLAADAGRAGGRKHAPELATRWPRHLAGLAGGAVWLWLWLCLGLGGGFAAHRAPAQPKPCVRHGLCAPQRSVASRRHEASR